MAVTKIRKISSWSLLAVMIINLVVLAIFYLGGIANPGAESKEPVYTGLLLNWMWALSGVTIAAAVVFAIWQFTTMLKDSPKSALTSLAAVVVFAAVLFITYSIGDGTPLQIVGYEGDHNVSFWLKLTDMWAYSSYILLILIVLSVVGGSVRKMLDR